MSKEFIAPVRVKPKNITVIILGALSMYRNKSAGSVSLLNVDGNPLCANQFVNIQSVFPDAEIFLVTGYMANSVISNKPSDLRVIENQLYGNTGNAEEIRLAINASVNNKFLIISGEVLPDKNALIQMKNRGSCTMVQKVNDDGLGTSLPYGKLQTIAYGLPNKWCKIAMLDESESLILKKFVNKKDKSTYYFHEILNYISSHSGVINIIENKHNVRIFNK
jgi:hypothetical protein